MFAAPAWTSSRRRWSRSMAATGSSSLTRRQAMLFGNIRQIAGAVPSARSAALWHVSTKAVPSAAASAALSRAAQAIGPVLTRCRSSAQASASKRGTRSGGWPAGVIESERQSFSQYSFNPLRSFSIRMRSQAFIADVSSRSSASARSGETPSRPSEKRASGCSSQKRLLSRICHSSRTIHSSIASLMCLIRGRPKRDRTSVGSSTHGHRR